MCSFITQPEDSCELTHLDLSGMSLREHIKPILIALEKNPVSKLVCVHLNDNDFSEETRNYMSKKLKINVTKR